MAIRIAGTIYSCNKYFSLNFKCNKKRVIKRGFEKLITGSF